jgi:hypothetical protein
MQVFSCSSSNNPISFKFIDMSDVFNLNRHLVPLSIMTTVYNNTASKLNTPITRILSPVKRNYGQFR